MSDKPPIFDDDNPEWTDEDFARARPITDYPELMAAFPNTLASNRMKVVTIAVDDDVLARFRAAAGADWRSRMNDALRAAAAGL